MYKNFVIRCYGFNSQNVIKSIKHLRKTDVAYATHFIFDTFDEI